MVVTGAMAFSVPCPLFVAASSRAYSIECSDKYRTHGRDLGPRLGRFVRDDLCTGLLGVVHDR